MRVPARRSCPRHLASSDPAVAAPHTTMLSLTSEGLLLTHKDQCYHLYSESGQLIAVGDGLGNEIHWEGVARIQDTSGRKLEFVYDFSGRLTQIIDPAEPGEATIQDRRWYLSYDTFGRLATLTDPMNYQIRFGYDFDGRITSVIDKDGAEYTYVYNEPGEHDPDTIREVTDPLFFTQSFASQAHEDNLTVDTTFTDRRGQDWVYRSIREDMTVYPINGPLAWIDNPLLQRDSLQWDASRNMTQYTDALGHQWSYTYDARGNLLTAASPLPDEVETWTYNSVNAATSYKDQYQFTTEYRYDLPGYPTLLTEIIEPPDGQGSGSAHTYFDYYVGPPLYGTCAPEEECKHGKLKEVIDPNGVVTALDYDEAGQLEYYREGQVAGQYIFQTYTHYDSGSRLTSSISGEPTRSASGGTLSYNANNHPISSRCAYARVTGPTPPGIPQPRGGVVFPDLPTDDAPTLPGMSAEWTDATYTGMGRLTGMDITVSVNGIPYDRKPRADYDELGVATHRQVQTGEAGTSFTRAFDASYDLGTGTFTRVGPDGVETITQLDVTNRVESIVRRVPGGAVLMSARYEYYANGLLRKISFRSGARVYYHYDDANRVTSIRHRDFPAATLLLQLDYVKN